MKSGVEFEAFLYDATNLLLGSFKIGCEVDVRSSEFLNSESSKPHLYPGIASMCKLNWESYVSLVISLMFLANFSLFQEM